MSDREAINARLSNRRDRRGPRPRADLLRRWPRPCGGHRGHRDHADVPDALGPSAPRGRAWAIGRWWGGQCGGCRGGARRARGGRVRGQPNLPAGTGVHRARRGQAVMLGAGTATEAQKSRSGSGFCEGVPADVLGPAFIRALRARCRICASCRRVGGLETLRVRAAARWPWASGLR